MAGETWFALGVNEEGGRKWGECALGKGEKGAVHACLARAKLGEDWSKAAVLSGGDDGQRPSSATCGARRLESK